MGRAMLVSSTKVKLHSTPNPSHYESFARLRGTLPFLVIKDARSGVHVKGPCN